MSIELRKVVRLPDPRLPHPIRTVGDQIRNRQLLVGLLRITSFVGYERLRAAHVYTSEGSFVACRRRERSSKLVSIGPRPADSPAAVVPGSTRVPTSGLAVLRPELRSSPSDNATHGCVTQFDESGRYTSSEATLESPVTSRLERSLNGKRFACVHISRRLIEIISDHRTSALIGRKLSPGHAEFDLGS